MAQLRDVIDVGDYGRCADAGWFRDWLGLLGGIRSFSPLQQFVAATIGALVINDTRTRDDAGEYRVVTEPD